MDLLRWRRGPQPDKAPVQDGELPSRINHYRIRGSLGQGGMGVVYLAEDERLGRNVALKVLRDNSADQSARLRLVREARIAAGVSHPLICQSSRSGRGRPSLSAEATEGKQVGLSAK